MKPRSQPSPAALSKTVFASQFGTVRVYTRRHIHGCPNTSPDQQNCHCPKWIYANPRQGRPTRTAAGTPSFTEASEQAQRILRGFDPEIRDARNLAQPAPGIPIAEALTRYYLVLGARKLSPGYLSHTVRAVFDRRRPRPNNRGKRPVNLPLLDYLDQLNLDQLTPGASIPIEQISGDRLDDWAIAWQTNDLTSKQWHTITASFFRWAAGRGHVLHPSLVSRLAARLPLFGEKLRIKAGNRCGYFSEEQMQKICSTLPFYRPRRGFFPEHYLERLGAMIDLGRWAGMAMADIVRFTPSVNLGANNVLTYRRQKTAHVAVVLLDPKVAARLRAIPSEQGSLRQQPLRFADVPEERSRGVWRDRFQKLCDRAEIGPIETEIGTVRRAHPHMLRDTFAIDAIIRGVSLDNVAKMLGHASVEMTQKAYLFWIQKRVDHCVEDQRRALARVQSGDVVVRQADNPVLPLVH